MATLEVQTERCQHHQALENEKVLGILFIIIDIASGGVNVLFLAKAVTCKRESLPLTSDFKVSCFSPRTLMFISHTLDTGERRGRLTRHNTCLFVTLLAFEQLSPWNRFLLLRSKGTGSHHKQHRDVLETRSHYWWTQLYSSSKVQVCMHSVYVWRFCTRESWLVCHSGLHLVHTYISKDRRAFGCWLHNPLCHVTPVWTCTNFEQAVNRKWQITHQKRENGRKS